VIEGSDLSSLASSPEASFVAARKPGLRIMLVEDELMVAAVMQDLLEDIGHTVVGRAHRLTHAYLLAESLLAEGGLDAAILDVYLNGEASFPVAQRLADAGIPVIFVTGYGPRGLDGRFPDAEVLTKPLTRDRLETVLRALTAHA
jgi:CheY-like chemotaxis protein